MTSNGGIPITIVLYFGELVLNDPPEQPIGARIEEIRVHVPGLFFRPGPGSGITTRDTSQASLPPTGILLPSNPVPRMLESILVYPVTMEIVPLVVGQTDCLLPEPILHAP